MLYVTRKPGESIMIDNHIEVTVLSVKGSTVRLGFSSLRPTNVLRKELHDVISKANQEASHQNAFLEELAEDEEQEKNPRLNP